jgi:Na+-driven multidrug efflux pump
VSISITTFLFNIIIIKYFWENGVAAATIILYFELIIYSIYMWLSNWIAPIESYYYWEKNYHALRKLVTHNLKIVLISSCVLTICSYLLGKYFITMLTWENELVYNLALSWSVPFFICFLFAWINIYTSSFFTSVWNDKISAIISIIRSIILTAIFIIIFPKIFWISWIWYSIPAAELLSIIVSYVCFKKYRKTYKL